MVMGEAVQDRKLFIGGLAPQTDSDTLKDYYSKWGNIVDVVVMKDNNTGRSRGFGFVTFSEASMAQKAVEDGPHSIDGKVTDTKRAVSKDSMDEKSSGPTDKVFVGGLTREITSDQLKEYFERFGAVKESNVMTDKETGESRCFAFVIFDDMCTVDKVMESKPHNLCGCQIDVQKAVTKEEMKRKSFGRPHAHGPSHRHDTRERHDYHGRYGPSYYDRGYNQWNPGYYSSNEYYGSYYDQNYYYNEYDSGRSDHAGGPVRGHYPQTSYDYQQYNNDPASMNMYNKGSSKGRGHTPYGRP